MLATFDVFDDSVQALQSGKWLQLHAGEVYLNEQIKLYLEVFDLL